MKKKNLQGKIRAAVWLAAGVMAITACGNKPVEDVSGVEGEATPGAEKPGDDSEKPTDKPSDKQDDKPGDKTENNQPDSGKAEDSTGGETEDPRAGWTEPMVYMSRESGFYAKSIMLELYCPVEGAEIYYTIDGSIPDRSSTKYEKEMRLTNRSLSRNLLSARKDLSVDSTFVPGRSINKANIIRAVAYLPDGTVTPVSNGTFFVGVDQTKQFGNVPVISLITDQENLVNYETGILVLGKTYDDWIAEDPANAEEPGWKSKGNFSNKGRDWERPVHMQYINGDGTVGVSADMGIRIKGASTRTYLQKSFRLIAREEYGTKNIKFPLIPDNERSDGTGEVKKYKSFVLRNGGNDCDYTKLRDPLLQGLVGHRNMETQQFVPCVVFLDGEYWGAYTLVEDYTDNYVQNNYDVESENVVIIKCGEVEEGVEEDIELFHELYRFITENDMKNAANYARVQEMLDIPGFIEYCAFELYIYNQDSIFDNNNWSIWRTREADGATEWSDGKWRMMLYDTEYSTGIYNGGSNYSTDNISGLFQTTSEERKENLKIYNPIEMFRSLMKNEEFKKNLILTLCDIRNYDFEKNLAVGSMKELAETYRLIVPDSLLRYGPDWAIAWTKPADYFQQKLDELTGFLMGRYERFPKIVQNAFGLSEAVHVSVALPSEKKGTVRLNYTLLAPEKIPGGAFTGTVFEGLYFTDYELTLEAVPTGEGRFVRWDVKNGVVADENALITTVKVSENCEITPIFE